MKKAKTNYLGVFGMALLATITCLTFLPVTNYEFLFWDDLTVIRDNPLVTSGLDDLGSIFTLDYVRFMPVSWLTFKTIAHFSGMDATWFHTVNLLLHALNATLLAILLLKILNRGDDKNPSALPAALLLAAFWAWHPLRAEPVAWTVDLYYILAGAFLLASLILLVQYHRRPRISLAVGSSLFLGLSITSYPPALTWSFSIPLLWMLLQKEQTNSQNRLSLLIDCCRKSAAVWVPSAILSIVVIAVTILARVTEQSAWYEKGTELPGMMTRGLYAAYSFSGLITRMVVPIELTPAWQPDAPGIRQIIPLILVASFALWLLLNKSRLAAQLRILFAMTLISSIPVLGLTEGNYIQPDRFTYCLSFLILAGVAAMIRIPLSATDTLRKNDLRRWRLVLLACLVCIPLSRAEIAKWSSTEALYDHLERVPWVEESHNLSRQLKFIRARYYTTERRYDEARILYKELLSDTKNAAVWREAARNEALDGKFEDSIDLLETLLEFSEDSAAKKLLHDIQRLIQ